VGQLIADRDRCWRILETSHPPVYYVPRHDIADGALAPGTGRSYCEFRGVASYCDIVAGKMRVHQAGWSDERPSPGYADIARRRLYPGRVDECRVAGELVRPQEGDFYGGWITADSTGPVKGDPGTMGW
jgi:uncharacterized protein (DUF427 family)